MKTLLLVEDDIELLNLLSEYFRRSDYIVHIATGANPASRILDEVEVDAIVTDFKMQNGDGIILIDKIATLKKRPILFFATAYPAYVIDNIKGFEAVFHKPFNLDELNKSLVAMLDKKDL